MKQKNTKLKGKVKSLRITYKAVEKFGEIEKWGKEEFKCFIIYNEKGNLIEVNDYDSDSSLDKKWTFKYDEKGNKIERNCYNSDGSLDEKWIFKYDEKGNEIEMNLYNSDGSLDGKWTFKYDDKGNDIEKNYYNSDGSLGKKCTNKYDYDKQNNWIKRIYYEDNKPYSITEREIEYY